MRAKVEGRELPKARATEKPKGVGRGRVEAGGFGPVRPTLSLLFGRQFTPILKTVKQFFVRLSYKFHKRTLLPDPRSICPYFSAPKNG